MALKVARQESARLRAAQQHDETWPRPTSISRQATGSLNEIHDEGTWHAASGIADGRDPRRLRPRRERLRGLGLPPEEDEVVAWKVASLREAGTYIMGRVTYEAMASVWPNTTGVYADVMNEIPKVVFSKTLTRADWAESRIAGGDLAEDIDQLKREPGGVILAHGGATFVDALIHDGLIDEYRLVIHPVAIGHGTGLFSALRGPLRLDLIEARRFPSGTAICVYRPTEENR